LILRIAPVTTRRAGQNIFSDKGGLIIFKKLLTFKLKGHYNGTIGRAGLIPVSAE